MKMKQQVLELSDTIKLKRNLMIEVDKTIRLSQNYYSSFDGKWSDFLINFGEHITSCNSKINGNINYVLLTPIDDLVPELIATGAMKGFLTKKEESGFFKLDSIIDELVKVPIGTTLTIIEKIYGLKPYQGELVEVNKDFLLIDRLDKENDKRGWARTADVEVSIPEYNLEGEDDVRTNLKSDKSIDINFKLLEQAYPGINPIDLLSIQENSIQIVGNKKLIEQNLKLDVKLGETKGSFDEILLSSAVRKNNKVLTNILSSDNDSLFNTTSNLTIFVQQKNKDISEALYWKNNNPRVIIIPRSSPQITELVPRLNKEFYKKESEVSLPSNCDKCISKNIETPKSCEVMGYL